MTLQWDHEDIKTILHDVRPALPGQVEQQVLLAQVQETSRANKQGHRYGDVGNAGSTESKVIEAVALNEPSYEKGKRHEQS